MFKVEANYVSRGFLGRDGNEFEPDRVFRVCAPWSEPDHEIDAGVCVEKRNASQNFASSQIDFRERPGRLSDASTKGQSALGMRGERE